MRKTNLLLMFLLSMLVSSVIQAQTFEGEDLTIELGEANELKRNYMSYLILGDDDVVFSLNTIKNKRHLVRYNENMVKEKTLLLTGTIVPKKAYIESIVAFNGGLVVFYSKMNKERKTNDLFYTTVSQEDFSIQKEETKVFALKYTSKRNSGNFDITFSRDSSKLMAYANTPAKRAKNARDEVSVVIMDGTYEVLWRDLLTIPYPDNRFSVEDLSVDNNGNVYILGAYYLARDERERGEQGYTYKLIAYLEEGHDREEIDLKLTDKFISDISYFIKPDGTILCSGLYSNNSATSAAGAFYLEIDGESMDVNVENLIRFDLDFLTEGLSERQTEKTKKKASKGKEIEFYRYRVRNLISKPEGGLIMVAEQYHYYTTTTTTTTANGGTTTTTTHHYIYNDIIVVSFDEDGELEWNQKIQKKQYSTNDGGYYSGFNLVVKDGVLHFFFVDNGYAIAGLDVDRKDGRDVYKGYHFAHASLSIDGEKKVESLGLVDVRRGFRPIPKEFVSLRGGRSVIYAKSRKEYKLGRVIID